MPEVKPTMGSVAAAVLSSASKIVFIMIALAVVFALFLNKISAEQFMILASMTFTFYFANKGESGKPFAGK